MPISIVCQVIASVLFSRFWSQYASTPRAVTLPVLGTLMLDWLLSHIEIMELAASVMITANITWKYVFLRHKNRRKSRSVPASFVMISRGCLCGS